MKILEIRKGTEISTDGGYMTVYGRGAELIYLEEFEIGENDEPISTGKRYLTLSEIAKEAHVDKVVIAEDWK